MDKIDLVSLIYDEMLIKDAERRAARLKKETRHFPSSLCAMIGGEFVGKCRRASFYSMTNVEPSNPMDAVAVWKMRMGDVIHAELDAMLNEALVRKFGSEVKIEGDGHGAEVSFAMQTPKLRFPVSGRIDKVMSFNGKITGVVAGEWKSTYGMGVSYIQKDGAKPDNILQCLAYLEQDTVKLDAIWLLYVARDSGFLYGFQIEKEGDHLLSKHLNSDVSKILPVNWPMVEQALVSLEEGIEKNVAPERDYKAEVNPKTNKLMQKSDWQCRYCSYMSLCHGCEA